MPRPRAPQRRGLTPSESEVTLLVARGMTNRQIATKVGTSEFTIKKHVSAALAKVGVDTRVQLALEFLRCPKSGLKPRPALREIDQRPARRMRAAA